MDMFRTANTAQPAPQPNLAVPGNIPPVIATTGLTGPAIAPNGVIPPTTVAAPKEPPAPLAEHATLWEPPIIDPAAPIKSDSVFGNTDPKKFMEAASKIDFTKVATPEELTAITAGGEAATKAMIAVQNRTAQSIYAQSAFASTKLIDAALAKAKDSFLADVDSRITAMSVKNNLREKNPLFTNPAIQPMISMVEAQMRTKFPNATPTEITEQTNQYIEHFASALAPKAAPAKGTKAAEKETDWSKFLN